MDVKPIRNEEDYDRALAEIEHLLDAAPGSEDADRLEVLSILVETYEETQHPIGPPDPVEAIKFRMEQEGLSRKDLEAYIGSKSKVSEVLNRTRPLSLPMVRRLHKGLGVPAEVLIQENGGKAQRASGTFSKRLGAYQSSAKRGSKAAGVNYLAMLSPL